MKIILADTNPRFSLTAPVAGLPGSTRTSGLSTTVRPGGTRMRAVTVVSCASRLCTSIGSVSRIACLSSNADSPLSVTTSGGDFRHRHGIVTRLIAQFRVAHRYLARDLLAGERGHADGHRRIAANAHPRPDRHPHRARAAPAFAGSVIGSFGSSEDASTYFTLSTDSTGPSTVTVEGSMRYSPTVVPGGGAADEGDRDGKVFLRERSWCSP